jgi:hypothetical protein
MEWVEGVTPIHVVEYELRRKGVFLLVDMDGRKLWFYGYKKDQGALRQTMESLKNRRDEMVKFLIKRASVRGETK